MTDAERFVSRLLALEPVPSDREAILALLPKGWRDATWQAASELFTNACEAHYGR